MGVLNIGSVRLHLARIMMERPEVNVWCLQEVRVKGGRVSGLPRGWQCYSQGRTDTTGGGVGFVVDERIGGRVVVGKGKVAGGREPEWMWLCVEVSPCPVYVCNLYSPPGTGYRVDRLEEEIREMRVRGLVLLCGDFNCDLLGDQGGTVQRRRYWDKLLKRVEGGWVVNKLDPRPTHHTKTVDTRLDFVVVWGVRVREFVVRSSGLDHNMLLCRIGCEGRVEDGEVRVRFRRVRRGGEVVKRFVCGVEEVVKGWRVRGEGGEGGVVGGFDWLVGVVKKVGGEVLGEVRRRVGGKAVKGLPFWNGELSGMCKRLKWLRRKEVVMRKRGRRGREVWLKVREERREVGREFRVTLRRRREQWYREMREEWRVNDLRVAYLYCHWLGKGWGGGGVKVSSFSNDELNEAWGKVFGVPPPVTCAREEWESSVERWLAEGDEGEWGSEGEEVSVGEVEDALRWAAAGKAPGMDGVSNEVWGVLGASPVVVGCLASLFSGVLRNPGECLPRSWKKSVVCLIPKKGTPTSPLDYRPICLLPHVAKLLESILWSRVKGWASRKGWLLSMEQGGFREGRGCPEQVWICRVVDDLYRSRKKPVYAAFLDLRKAYDSVPVFGLCEKLCRKGLPKYFIRFVREWVQGHRRVLLATDNDVELEVLRGVPQGSVLAPFLFNCFVDDLVQELGEVEGVDGVVVGKEVLRCLLYADDVVLFGETPQSLQRLLDVCGEWALKWGMTWAPHKSKVIRMGSVRRSDKGGEGLVLGGVELEEVERFVYLGVEFAREGTRGYLSNRSAMEKVERRFGKIGWLYRPGNGCPVSVGSAVCQSVLFPGPLYGSEVYRVRQEVDKWVGKVAKHCLGTYDCVSTTGALKWLGWQTGRVMCGLRVVSFLAKLLQSRYELVRSVLRWCLGEGVEGCRWLKYVWECGRELGCEEVVGELVGGDEEGWASVGDRLVKVCESVRERVKEGHCSVSVCPSTAHFSFIFGGGMFNPRGVRVGECPVCGEGVDGADHLLYECRDVRVGLIVSEVCEKGGFSGVEEVRERLGDVWGWNVGLGEGVLDERGVVELSKGHKRLWRLRTVEWRKRRRGEG